MIPLKSQLKVRDESNPLADKFTQNQCSCERCALMCHHSPCTPTPEEAIRLLESEFAKHMMLTVIPDIKKGRLAAVIAPKGIHREDSPARRCILLENGLCRLHDTGLKPLEGRLASHDNTIHQSAQLRSEMLSLWKSSEGMKAIVKYARNVKGYEKAELHQILRMCTSDMPIPEEIYEILQNYMTQTNEHE